MQAPLASGGLVSPTLDMPLSSPIVWLPAKEALPATLDADPTELQPKNGAQPPLAFYVRRWRGFSSAVNPPFVADLAFYSCGTRSLGA